MYMPLVAKMASRVYFELLCNVNLLITLSCLLPILETIHELIKFVQKWLYFHYSNLDAKNVLNVFKEFLDLVDCSHNTMHLKLKANLVDFNTFDVEYLYFESLGYSF
jgi:hypothetical protein